MKARACTQRKNRKFAKSLQKRKRSEKNETRMLFNISSDFRVSFVIYAFVRGERYAANQPDLFEWNNKLLLCCTQQYVERRQAMNEHIVEPDWKVKVVTNRRWEFSFFLLIINWKQPARNRGHTKETIFFYRVVVFVAKGENKRVIIKIKSALL